MRRIKLPVATILCCCEGSRVYMRHPATEVTRCAIRLRQVEKRRVCVCARERCDGCAGPNKVARHKNRTRQDSRGVAIGVKRYRRSKPVKFECVGGKQ